MFNKIKEVLHTLWVSLIVTFPHLVKEAIKAFKGESIVNAVMYTVFIVLTYPFIAITACTFAVVAIVIVTVLTWLASIVLPLIIR